MKMNRQQRRATLKGLRKKTETAAWEPLKVVLGVVGYPLAPPGMIRALNNHTYAIQVFEEVETPFGVAQPIGIRRHDGNPVRLWSDVQRIKNEVAGEDRIAIQVFPAERDLVNFANMYWLYIMPAEIRFAFTLPKRGIRT